MNKYLRKRSLDRRMGIFYLLLCVLPVTVLFLVAAVSGSYQQRRSREGFDQSYFEQITRQFQIMFDRYEQKISDAAENNDLQADVMLYTRKEAYRNPLVYERIEQVLDNLCREEQFFDSVILHVGDKDVFSSSVTFSSGWFAGSVTESSWRYGEDENIYYTKFFQIGTGPAEQAAMLVKCNKKQLEDICDRILSESSQKLRLITADGQLLYGSDDGSTGNLSRMQAVLSNGWLLEMEKNTDGYSHGMLAILLMSLLFLAISAFFIRLLRDSLVLPLKEISAKLRQIGTDSQKQNTIVVEAESFNQGIRDEHALLDVELNRMLRRQKELTDTMYVHRIQEEKLQLMIRELELNAMQQQINPHFLLNILDTIYWMAEEKGYTQTEEMIATLGEYFRLSVSYGDRYVRIAEEIENAKSYLQILTILHEARFKVEWDVDPALLECYTVRLILQPLIENAYEHGLKKKKEGGVLSISCQKHSSDICFTIQDNGSGIEAEQVAELMEYLNDGSYETKKSVGTKNVNMRIQMYFGEMYGLHFVSVKNEGTTAIIRIPCLEKGDREYVSGITG